MLDLPVGPTAKVRTARAAQQLADGLTNVGAEFGLKTRIVPGDGLQPIGRGIGPALEARDVLAVLRGEADAPQDLRQRALALAAALLELTEACPAGRGEAIAADVLDSGRAWRKFQRICEAQGGMRDAAGLAPAAPRARRAAGQGARDRQPPHRAARQARRRAG